MEKQQCTLCKIKLSEFDANGKHNFAPHVIKGEIKDICMECKMMLVKGSGSWTGNKIIR